MPYQHAPLRSREKDEEQPVIFLVAQVSIMQGRDSRLHKKEQILDVNRSIHVLVLMSCFRVF